MSQAPTPEDQRIQIGEHRVTLEDLQACADRTCSSCHGVGLRRSRGVVRLCECALQAAMKKYGVTHAPQRPLSQDDVEREQRHRASVVASAVRKASNLEDNIKALTNKIADIEAMRATGVKEAEDALGAVAMNLDAQAAMADDLKASIAKNEGQIAELKDQISLREGEIAKMRESLEATAVETAASEERVTAARASLDAARSVNQPAIDGGRKRLEKLQRRLSHHLALHGAAPDHVPGSVPDQVAEEDETPAVGV